MHSSNMLLILTVFLLGLRHGFDLDHLATIDAMTRTVGSQRKLSRFVGVLFSLGHGSVVTLLSVIIGSGIMQAEISPLLSDLGSYISLVFLFTFGGLTLWNVMQNSSSAYVPAGIGSYVTRRLYNRILQPSSILFTGALFAFSFDTFSQVALFSISASTMSGWIFSGLLGGIFMLGMMTADGLNGWLVASLIRRADKKSQFVSRLLGFVIAIFSISIGCITAVDIIRKL